MAITTAPAGGGPSGAAAGEAHPYAGRVDVAERVLRKVAHEAVATTVGVGRGDVSVDVAEFRGGIAVRASTPLPIPNLEDTAAVENTKPVLERIGDLQIELRDGLSRLLGRDITRVNVTITGAVIPERKRVL
ncbi:MULTISPECIES: hypothetical protein [unclassified Microbacterium]|jgi:hypothetical protein|uniref:hypothetical protein n=1 Tax=unclassified Microbacterium TaxID=2609290 RepID=UPI00040AFD97|nr:MULTISPECIES: hypothetical protein [unclassified Microbacterium]PQZ54318.1 hypothetical protein CQ032_13655 [Microbacterium sp. MYb43]PQZ75402.1 hypothetical protein CQ031_14220 [Microbacterium sp. MYb40]PRB19556.1 hypothetical protein CQ040_15035 [Microbacterium sp. MYb54]PRB25755.1 hypothetical protein CQ037_14600 [Microbacterium sp. MYb50]PRB64238.1 hypothetical protein CQ021_15030 [Microbacterium sp. MYb24]